MYFLRNKILLIGIVLFFLADIYLVNSQDFEFNGTVYDINGAPLNNTVINITIRDQTWTIVGYNDTVSNESGWFNLTVGGNQNWFYEPLLQHFNDTYIDFIGQSLPAFPYGEFSRISDVNFYLKNAGTINITAVNSTGDRVTFNYMVKDTKLGYPLESDWQTSFSEVLIYVPADRNYSVMIYPQSSLPVSYNIDNMTSYENNTVVKEFNTSLTLAWVYGNINVSGISGWDEFTVIPFLIEPGNMIFIKQAGLPYNMSAWQRDGNGDSLNETDNFTLNSGSYNMTFIAPAESATFLLFAAARNDTTYYGGFTNISLSYGNADLENNFTEMAGLFGLSGDGSNANSNISLNNAEDWNQINISSLKQEFNLLNATNGSLSQVSAHLEATVDYSSYGAMEFTFMEDIEQTASASFYLPLLNVTGIKEINVYSQMYAPRRLTMTAAQIQDNPNITLYSFNPGDIDESDAEAASDISVAFYISNSSCDEPNPVANCAIGDLNMDTFNPLSAIIGGGAISFRMGIGNILIHYVNVDMLASGPPDAAFDDSVDTNASSGDSFGAALRFGSKGPTMYDYVLVSVPYSDSAGNLDDTKEVNMSMPVLYDDDWNVIWNATDNGTSGSDLAGNDSHYSTYQSDWEVLMNGTTCVTNSSSEWFNITSPCYIDSVNNKVWIRLPHFSGTGPSISGGSIAASSSPGGGGGTSGGAAGASSDLTVNGMVKILGLNQESTFTYEGVSHKMKVDYIYEIAGEVVLTITSEPIQITIKKGEIKKLDLDNDGKNDMSVALLDIVNGMAKLLIKKIIETVAEPIEIVGEEKEIEREKEELIIEEEPVF